MKWFGKRSKPRSICVVGCGKLGLPLVAVLADAGHSVVGFDLDQSLIGHLSAGHVPWFEESLQELVSKNKNRIRFTNNLVDALLNIDFFLVIVPSPSDTNGVFESKFVEEAISSIVALGTQTSQSSSCIVIVSTLMPGSTDRIWEQTLGKYPTAANQFQIVYSPEFIALGSVVKDMKNPDLVLIGAHDSEAAGFYQDLVSSYVVSKPTFAHLLPKEAEIAKIAVNSFVTTKISFANFISELCESSGGASASRVLASIGADSRIGRSYLKPGAPFGGPCFPRDNVALSKFSESIGVDASIAYSTQTINERQIIRISRFIERFGRHKKVLIVGVAYKPGTAVTDESPSLRLSKELESRFSIDLLDDYIQDARENKGFHLVSHSEVSAEPVCAVFMVPDSRYLKLLSLLHEDSVIIDLWGNLKSHLSEYPQGYYCLGDVLEAK